MNLKNVAAIAHEANRMLCQVHGDTSQPEWRDAPDWQTESIINGVRFHLGNPEAELDESHENWLAIKYADGWVYGDTKDLEIKTHPCMAPFVDLPPEQQAKKHLFRAIVHALAPFVPEEKRI